MRTQVTVEPKLRRAVAALLAVMTFSAPVLATSLPAHAEEGTQDVVAVDDSAKQDADKDQDKSDNDAKPEPTPEPEKTADPEPEPTSEPAPEAGPETSETADPEPTAEPTPEPTTVATPVPAPVKTTRPVKEGAPEEAPEVNLPRVRVGVPDASTKMVTVSGSMDAGDDPIDRAEVQVLNSDKELVESQWLTGAEIEQGWFSKYFYNVAPGNYTAVLTAWSTADDSNSASVSFTVDEPEPEEEIIEPTLTINVPAAYYDGRVQVSGTITEGNYPLTQAVVFIIGEDKSDMIDYTLLTNEQIAQGKFTVTFTGIPVGNYHAVILAGGEKGGESSAQVAFTRPEAPQDYVPPTGEFDEGSYDFVGDTVVITGKIHDGSLDITRVQVELHSDPIVKDAVLHADGTFTATFTNVPAGQHTAYLTAFDSQGVATDLGSVAVLVEAVDPDAPVVDPVVPDADDPDVPADIPEIPMDDADEAVTEDNETVADSEESDGGLIAPHYSTGGTSVSGSTPAAVGILVMGLLTLLGAFRMRKIKIGSK